MNYLNSLGHDWLKKLEKYLNEGNNNKIEELLKEMPQLDINLYNGGNLLHTAASENLSLSTAYLIKAGLDVNYPKKHNGETPLHRAAMKGSYDVAKILIEAGCNVNAIDANGRNCLHHVAWSTANGTIVKTLSLLLENGALMDVYDNEDNDPLLYAMVRRGSFKSIDDPCSRETYFEFVHWQENHAEILGVIVALLKAGRDLNRKNKLGLTVFNVAAASLLDDSVPKFLLKLGATFDYEDPLIIDVLECRHKYITEVPLLLLRHTAFFDVQNRKDGPKNFNFEKLNTKNQTIYASCKDQLEMMKSMQLYELVKVYNILVDKDIGPYARNEVVINEFEKLSQDMLKKFPSYAELIFDRFKYEKIKQDLIKTATQKLNYIFNKNDKVFSIIVTDTILRFLPLEDLRTLSSL